MIHNTYPIHVDGSAADAKLVTYIQEYSPSLKMNIRPLVLICPGGGYEYTSDREAESIALQFLAMGYHAAILRYSCAPAKYPTALLELATCVKMLREHAAEWNIAEDKIIVQGCSAGGHLAASFGMFWSEDFVAQALGVADKEILRPNGMILCYPVITSGEFAHRGSFDNLLGEQVELLEKMSLEKQVSANTPKAFIWHTFEDGSVPVENSLLLVGAMRKAGIPTEFHMYPKGGHGLGLATKLTETADGRNVQPECASWIGLAHIWLEGFCWLR